MSRGIKTKTHDIIKEPDCYVALGRGRWFSWIITHEYGEWVVSSIYGRYYGTFPSFEGAIQSLTENV